MSRTSPGRRRAPRADHDRRREEVPRAAAEVFAAHGRDLPSGVPDRAGLTGALHRLPGSGPPAGAPAPGSTIGTVTGARAVDRLTGAGPFTGEGDQ